MEAAQLRFDYEETVDRVFATHKRKVSQLNALEQELGLYFDEEEAERIAKQTLKDRSSQQQQEQTAISVDEMVKRATAEHKRKVSQLDALKQDIGQYFDEEEAQKLAEEVMKEFNVPQEEEEVKQPPEEDKPSKEDVSNKNPLQQLDLVVIDYENNYVDNKKKNKNKSKDVLRGFSKQKEMLIEEVITNKIKGVSDSIQDVMEYAFDTMNDKVLRMYRDDIMKYCGDNGVDMKKLGAMGRERFCDRIVDNCCGKVEEDEKKVVKKRLDDLYEVIAQYDEYKQLMKKLEENQNNLCCTCYCNYDVLEPLNIYKREIYQQRMTLEVTNGKNVEMKDMNQDKMEQQIKLNSATNKTEAKYIEEDEDDVNGDILTILFNDDNLISSFDNNKSLVWFCVLLHIAIPRVFLFFTFCLCFFCITKRDYEMTIFYAKSTVNNWKDYELRM